MLLVAEKADIFERMSIPGINSSKRLFPVIMRFYALCLDWAEYILQRHNLDVGGETMVITKIDFDKEIN